MLPLRRLVSSSRPNPKSLDPRGVRENSRAGGEFARPLKTRSLNIPGSQTLSLSSAFSSVPLSQKLARFFQLAARYTESPRALRVKTLGGTPETFWKLDQPWFHELGLQAVIDVGANEGQFSRTMRCLLPEVEIFAFEPIPECHARTQQCFADDTHFKLFNLALGDRKAEATFKVSAITGASSLLPMSSTQAHYFPASLAGREIVVPVETLDTVMAGERLRSPYLLKLDVQGYEHQVLSGGLKTLAGAAMVLLEASYEPFYEGQRLFDDVYDLLRQHGFQLRDSFNMMYDPSTGRPLQGDFTFLRAK
jgi:FkbM family methyltransferase